MFNNATIYRISTPLDYFNTVAVDISPFTFEPCGPTQEKSVGWIPPRGHENGALIESVAGELILKLMIETKAVPADVVKREVAERVAREKLAAEQAAADKLAREHEQLERDEIARLAKLNTTMVVEVPAAPVSTVAPMPARAPVATAAPATLQLGKICARLGVGITKDFISAELCIEPKGRDRSAVLYSEDDFSLICESESVRSAGTNGTCCQQSARPLSKHWTHTKQSPTPAAHCRCTKRWTLCGEA